MTTQNNFYYSFLPKQPRYKPVGNTATATHNCQLSVMADADHARGGASSKQNDYDPRLDFFSDRFDPVLALNTPGVVPPRTDAKTHDNLSAYERAWNKQQQQPIASQSATKTVKNNEGGAVFERKWLPHQCKSENVRVWCGCHMAQVLQKYMGT